MSAFCFAFVLCTLYFVLFADRLKGVRVHYSKYKAPSTKYALCPLSSASLHFPNLLNTRLMPTTFEIGAEPSRHDLGDVTLWCCKSANCQHVGIVVLARESRCFFRPGYGRAHPWNLIRRNRHSCSRATNQETLLCPPLRYLFRNLSRVVRIIHRLF